MSHPQSRPPSTLHSRKIPMWVTEYGDSQDTRLPVLKTAKSQANQDESVTLIPREMNTKLYRPRVQKTFAIRAIGNMLLSIRCRTPRLHGMRTAHVAWSEKTASQISQLSKGGREQATKHFSPGLLSRGQHWC